MKKIVLLISLLLTSVLTYAQVNPPTAVKAQQVNLENKALIEWTASTTGTVTGYKVYYNVKGAAKVDSVRLNTTSVTLTNLTLDKEYVIRVRAFKATVTPKDTTYSTYTTPVEVIVAGPLVKPVITVDKAFTTPNRVTVGLKDTNPFETGFEIRLESEGPDITVTVDKVASPEIPAEIIQNLKPKTQYKITARAIRTVTGIPQPYTSPWSDPVYETTKVAPPPAAVNFKVEQDCPYGVAFSWSYAERQEDIVNVHVEYSFDGWNFTKIGEVTPNEKFFYFAGAEPGARFYYRVTTYNATGNTLSGPFEIYTKGYVNPNPPKNVRSLQDPFSKYTTYLTVAWDPGDQDNVCKTNIVVNTEVAISVNGGPMKTVVNLPNYVQQYKIEGLKPKDVVDIFLRTHSDKGKLSEWTSVRDVTYGPPSAVQNFIGVLNKDNFGNQVLYLSWTDTPDESQYYVERSTDGTNFSKFTFLKQDETRLPDTQVKEGVSYFYRIAAENEAGLSPYTNVGPFFISYTSAPNAPYGLVAKRNGNGVDLTWVDDSIKEEKYIVEKSTDTDANYIKIAELGRDVTSFRDENVSAGKTYFYRVRAWNPAFEFSAYTAPAKIMIPAATAGFAFDATVYPNPISETLNIKAEGVNGTTSYRLRIFDPNNHLVLDKQITFGQENTASVAIRSLAPGAYNMTLSDGKEKVSKKIVKL
ncbi:MAG: fibronectin type III domain-containing protein [Leadbetterella sp.]|nr:fibronectin type III domain-containing protein [Leadbetterella sp.]